MTRHAPHTVPPPRSGAPDRMHHTIVVTDGEQRSALATVRSLGRAGYAVHVCSTRSHSLAGASRYARSHTTVRDPLSDPSGYVVDLSQLCSAVAASTLIPISEPSLLAVLPHRERFGCDIPFSTIEQFTAICDKERVLELGSRHGIRVPRQRVVATAPGTFPAGEGMVFPVVLKPSRSVAGPEGHRVKVGVSYADDEAQLQHTLNTMAPGAFPVLLQERIEGPGFAISVLVWNGQALAAFAHERIREKPPSGGVSVLRGGLSLDHDLLARSLALLQEFDWRGVAMVEYKLDSRTGTPVLMEINGRFWGSLQLAIDAGVDFPVLLVRAALGDAFTPVLSYDSTTRTRWELGDVDHLLLRMRRSATRLHLPRGAPGRVRVVADFLRGFGPGIRQEILQWDDPRPFVREALDWLRGR